MKKLICLILTMVMVLSLSSCFLLAKEVENAEGTTGVGETNSFSDTREIKEFDENGNPILTSTDDRLVYPYENDGYVVFVCFRGTIEKIQRIYEFDSNEAAEEYVLDVCVDAVDAGRVPPRYAVKGNYAIIDVGFDTNPESLGFYYTKSKTIVLNDFGSKEEITE